MAGQNELWDGPAFGDQHFSIDEVEPLLAAHEDDGTRPCAIEDAETGVDQDNTEKRRILDQVFEWVLKSDAVAVAAYVDILRQHNPEASDLEIARKIVSRKSLKSGLVGAVTGVPGFISLPVTVPTDLALNLRIQASMAFAVAYVFGYSRESIDIKTDLYLIMCGDAIKETLKRAGIEVGKNVTRKTVEKYITYSVMKKIWVVAGRRIITKAGEKSAFSFMKMVPLVGAPVGFVFDWATTRLVGNAAIKYYSE